MTPTTVCCGRDWGKVRSRVSHQSHHARRRPSIAERFWGRVRKGPGCWTWTASANNHGYGTIHGDGRGLVYAHRIAWEMAHGPIPDGLDVCHHCDNPPCVKTEPDERYPDGHLFLGTARDNGRDMAAKGRSAWGERNASTRLTEADVLAIRLSDEQSVVLAERYGVRADHVWRVRTGRQRRHSPGPIGDGRGLLVGHRSTCSARVRRAPDGPARETEPPAAPTLWDAPRGRQTAGERR